MHIVSETITYVLLFVALYFEVFMFVTYFDGASENKRASSKSRLSKHIPSVSIIVPCWNEGNTISATIDSLLNLNYPKEKLKILIVDDGSTDNTWNDIQKFKSNPQIKLLRKENGGKHTALNYALEFIESDLVGCLDADSFVDKEALNNIVQGFAKENNGEEIMAVTPSIKVYEPRNIIELIQKVEYDWGILLRNILAKLGAIYVTPGPFTIFRREVFENLGGYRHAYLTEDMEMALRMQTNKYKIGNAPDAFVYTVSPKTIRSLFKQRLRWTYGFLKNTIDYKHILFKPEYGNLGMVILPIASISIFSSIYMLGMLVANWIIQIANKISEIRVIGINMHWNPVFDWFYMDTNIITFIALIAFVGTLIILGVSRKMSEGKLRPGVDVIYFLSIYAFLAPLWMTKAVYNVVFSKNTTWR